MPDGVWDHFRRQSYKSNIFLSNKLLLSGKYKKQDYGCLFFKKQLNFDKTRKRGINLPRGWI